MRRFRDRQGVTWQVWEIDGDRLHSSTRAEDFLQPLLEGWLVFESENGAVKRRLCPIPEGWMAAPEAELEQMCGIAEVVRSRRSVTAKTGAEPLPAPPVKRPERTKGEAQPESASSRSFLYPGGRVWTAAEIRRDGAPADVGGRSVLRFTAGRRSLDLEHFPEDWARQSDAALVELLHRGFPRPRSTSDSPAHRRRRSDHQA